jgi:hypothetical protein
MITDWPVFFSDSYRKEIILLQAKKSVMPVSQKTKKRKPVKKWSGRVTATSNALDLEQNVFKSRSPETIAKSLKRSAENSKRRKGTPLQSAMSMLNFYINRGGKNLSQTRKKILERAKGKLRELFGKKKKSD